MHNGEPEFGEFAVVVEPYVAAIGNTAVGMLFTSGQLSASAEVGSCELNVPGEGTACYYHPMVVMSGDAPGLTVTFTPPAED